MRKQSKAEQKLDKFYKEYFKDGVSRLMSLMVVGIMGFMLVIIMWIPFEEKPVEFLDLWIPAIFVLLGGWMYILPYINLNNQEIGKTGKIESVIKILRFLPIERRDISIYLIKKVLRIFLTIFLIGLAGQLLFTMLFVGTIGIWNVLYPFLSCLVFPFVVFVPLIWFVKE
ncbi:MAG: hypothetical protein IJ274_10590 [Lachnospiraceae bacterium]|nr:hypothetical protein [Lachnospiraceae bacterium]